MVRVRGVLAGLIATVLIIGGTAVGAAAQTEDLSAWCQARLDVEAAFSTEDEATLAAALAALSSSAPADIATESQTVEDRLAEKGEKAFGNKKFLQAVERIDEYTVENCGFPVVEVSAIDYELTGVPETLEPGTTVFDLSNDAPKEEHEIVIFRVNDGVDTPVKKLLSFPEKKIEKLISFAGAAQASPGSQSASVTVLEPGRYVYACFVPTGGKKKGAPHFTKGMFGEFEVAAA